ncbi:MAG: 50S ribosomal protein L6 [Chlamydiales bacterium]
MSRLGKKPVFLPKGIEIQSEKNSVQVKGPKGILHVPVPEGITLAKKENEINITAKLQKEKIPKALSILHGLTRSLLHNAIIGVSDGFEKKLVLVGVGYKAQLKGAALDLQIGTSHPVELPIPDGINVKVDKNILSISGIDKQKVGQFAAVVRAKKPVEPYKGKGIHYQGEYIRKKAGKTAKGK